jgi:hypothetical protein
VTSEKTSMMNVKKPAAIATPLSPYNSIAIRVVIADASMFTKLFNRRIKPKVFSGLFNR